MRIFWRAALALVLLLSAAVAIAVVFRVELLDREIRRALADGGAPEAQFEITALGLSETVIERFELGPDLPSAERIAVSYTLLGLVSGRIDAVAVRALRHQSADPVGLLAGLAGAEGAEEQAFSVGALTLENAVIRRPDRAGGGEMTVDGAIGLEPALTADLRASVALAPLSAALTLQSTDLGEGGVVTIGAAGGLDLADIAPGDVERLRLASGRLDGRADGALTREGAGWRLALEGRLTLTDAARAGGTERAEGAISFAVAGDASELALSLSEPARFAVSSLQPDTLAPVQLGDRAVLSLSAVGDAPLAVWRAEAAGGRLRVEAALALDGAADSGPAPRLALSGTASGAHGEAFALSEAVALDAVIEGRALALEAAPGRGVLARLAADIAGAVSPGGALELAGDLDVEAGDVAVGGFSAERAAVAGAVTLARGPDRLAVTAAPGLEITLDGAASGEDFALDTPARLTLEAFTAERAEETGHLRLAADLAPVSGALGAVAFAEAGASLLLDMARGDVPRTELTLSDGALRLPGAGVAVDALSARLPLGALAEEAPVALAAEIRDTAAAARFPPAALTLEGGRDGDVVMAEGVIDVGEGAATLPAIFTADVAAPAATMTIADTRVAFARRGLQPADLSAALSDLRDVTGAVRIGGVATLGAEGLGARVNLQLDNLSGEFGPVEIEGVSGPFNLAGVAPLATAGPQRLTARRLVAGLPVEDVSARISLREAGGGVALRLRDAQAALAGGALAIEDARWSSVAAVSTIPLEVRDVSIERLLSEWLIEGISGTGRLSGVLPLTFGRSGEIGVDDGKLIATETGVVQVDWGPARERLASSAFEVGLLVEALEDFRYTVLEIGLDQPQGGALSLPIKLDGANPTVLEGQPFEFNIGVEGDLAPLLQAVREGRRIGRNLLSGGVAAPN